MLTLVLHLGNPFIRYCIFLFSFLVKKMCVLFCPLTCVQGFDGNQLTMSLRQEKVDSP